MDNFSCSQAYWTFCIVVVVLPLIYKKNLAALWCSLCVGFIRLVLYIFFIFSAIIFSVQ